MFSFLLLPFVATILSSVPIHQEPASDDCPWQSAFDGKTLDGWTTTGGRYDGKAVWGVEDGAITGRQGPGRKGGLIYTTTKWTNFEMSLDAWVDYPFDSGIFVRMRPDQDGMQFTLDNRPGGEIGGLYSGGYFLHNPGGEKHWKQGAWNKVRVRVAGNPMHLEMWINDTKTTDYFIPDGTRALATEGLIGLQVHGGGNADAGARAAFRNIQLRPLPVGSGRFWTRTEKGAMELTPAGTSAGWKSLFNGKDFAGWQGAGEGQGYEVRDGEMAFLVKGSSSHLITKEDYRNFQLRLDFKTARRANSGLFLRADRNQGNPAFSGREVQILDDHNWEADTNSKLKPWQFTGSLYGSVAPNKKKALRPLGEWNTMVVTLNGPRMITVLNGKILYDVDTEKLKPVQGPLFAKRAASGYIGLQRHASGSIAGDAYAWFRNIYVRELP